MANESLELLREGFERLDAEGYESMVPLIHPDFEMETPANLAAEPQRYEGVEGFRRWWTSFLEVMDDGRARAEAAFTSSAPDRYAVETVDARRRRLERNRNDAGSRVGRHPPDGKMVRIDFATSLDEAMPKAGIARLAESAASTSAAGIPPSRRIAPAAARLEARHVDDRRGHAPSARRRRSPGRRRRGFPRGTSSNARRRGLAAQIGRSLEERRRDTGQRALDQADPEALGVLAARQRIAALGVVHDEP